MKFASCSYQDVQRNQDCVPQTTNATTTREDFTGRTVVQIWPASNPPSTNAIALNL